MYLRRLTDSGPAVVGVPVVDVDKVVGIIASSFWPLNTDILLVGRVDNQITGVAYSLSIA